MSRSLFEEPVKPTCPGCPFSVVCSTTWQLGVAPRLMRREIAFQECYRYVPIALKHKQETGYDPPATPEEMLQQLGRVRTQEERAAAASMPVGLLETPYPWWEDELAVLDCETTGTDPYVHRIVSLALLMVDPAGKVIESWGLRTLVNPGVAIPAEAIAVHGLTEADIKMSGITPAEALAQVAPRLEQLARNAAPLVIYNACYDHPLVQEEAKRVGLTLPGVALIDPLCIDRGVDRYRKGGRKLATVAAHYGVALSQAHEAGADAVAAVGIARAIARRYPEVRSMSLAELQAAQRTWYDAWRDGMNRFWKERNLDKKPIAGTWPVGLGHPDPAPTPEPAT